MTNKDISVSISVQDNASKALKSISGAFSTIGAKAKAGIAVAGSAMDSLSKKAKDNEGNFAKMGAVGGVALYGISGAMQKTIDDASNLKNSLVGLNSIVKGTGGDMTKAKELVERFTADGLVTASEAATSLKNLLAKGFSMDQAEQMMIRFKDSAAFGRQAALGLGEAIAGATEGIKNENSMLVDNAGVTKNVSVMVAEYAKAHGLKETALTAAQKNEAVYQGILKETTFQLGDASKLSAEYSGQVARLDAQKLQLSQTIGNILMPAMARMIGVISPALTLVINWAKENPKMTEAIIFGSIALAGLTTAIGAVGLVIPSIITGFGAVVIAAQGLGTALLFLTTNPIGLLLTALAAIVAASIYIYTNWNELAPKFKKVWTDIGGTIAYAIDGIIKKFDQLIAYSDSVKSALRGVGSSIYQATHDESGSFSLSGARANGGPVSGGQTYLVGERGPELFTPSRSGAIVSNESIGGGGAITVNMGGVTISNAADADALVDRVKTLLIREIQLAKKGLYA